MTSTRDTGWRRASLFDQYRTIRQPTRDTMLRVNLTRSDLWAAGIVSHDLTTGEWTVRWTERTYGTARAARTFLDRISQKALAQ